MYQGEPASIHGSEDNALVGALDNYSQAKLLGAWKIGDSFVWSDDSAWDFQPGTTFHGNENFIAMTPSGNWGDYTRTQGLPQAVCQQSK